MESPVSTNSLGVPWATRSYLSLGFLQDPPLRSPWLGVRVVLNEHAQSNGSPEVPCMPIFKLHSRIFWLESRAKVKRGDASGRDGGSQGFAGARARHA